MSTEPDASSEVARLEAERDALRAELDQARRPRREKLRAALVPVLVFLTCLSLVVATVGVWARRNFLDTDRFVQRAAPLVHDPSVQAVLTNRLTDQAMELIDPRKLFEEVLPERGRLLAIPLANAVKGFVHDRVERFVASDTFAELWAGALTVAHRTAADVLRDRTEVVDASGGQVELNLLPIIDAVLAQISGSTPEILGREVTIPKLSVEDLPDAAIPRLERALGVDLPNDFGQVTVYDDGRLASVQAAVRLFDRLVVLFLPLSLVFAALALRLSSHRRRTLLQLSAGIAIGMVVVRRASFRVQEELTSLPPTPEGTSAMGVVLDEFLDPLRTFAAYVLVVVALVAAGALLSGDYGWAVSLRRRARSLWTLGLATGDRVRDEETTAWVRGHRDVLLAAGALVGIVLLAGLDLSWFGMLLVLALVAAFEATVYRMATTPVP